MTEVEFRQKLQLLHAESFGWAMHCCDRQSELAKDVLQTAYVRAIEAEKKFKGQSQFKTWLFTIIKNTAISSFKRKKEMKAKFITIDSAPELVAHEADKILLPFLERALESLSAKQQELMHLIFYQNMSINQAADVMEISRGTARQHYHRAKKQLSAWIANKKIRDL